MSAKLMKCCGVYRCTSYEQLKELLSNNLGRVFQIYVTVNLEVNGGQIPAWTIFNVQMPALDDIFVSYGYQTGTGEIIMLYGTNLDNIKVRSRGT